MSREYEEMQVEKLGQSGGCRRAFEHQPRYRSHMDQRRKTPRLSCRKRYKFKISEVDEWVREGKIQE